MPALTFELVAPERLLVSQPVAMVIVPGTEGDMGILAGHAPLISGLRTGVVDVRDDSNAVGTRYFVAGGFIEVTGERCTVMAEEAIPVSEMNPEALSAERETVQAALMVADTADSKAELSARLTLIDAKLAVFTRH